MAKDCRNKTVDVTVVAATAAGFCAGIVGGEYSMATFFVALAILLRIETKLK